jgi:hypothetical protein
LAIQYAFVNNNGEVVHVMSPGMDDMFQEGQVIDGNTVVYISSLENPGVFIETKYYLDGEWKTRSPKPGRNYNWSMETENWLLDQPRLMQELRTVRNMKLYETDWTQLADNKLTPEARLLWENYRQSLREVPQNNQSITDLTQVVWPTPPL